MKINVPKFLLILILVSCTSQPSEGSFQTSIAQTVNARLGESALTQVEESPTSITFKENEPASEVNIVTFNAIQNEIQQGQCTILGWKVEGGFGVELDGQLVNLVDDREVCPEETTTYWLKVDRGDRLVEEQVTIQVLVSSSEDVDTLSESTQQPIPQGSVPNAQPPTVKPPDVPTNCYISSTEFITDLAITDIYPGNMPKGQFWVRITNNGPATCSNVNFNFLGCAADETPKSYVSVIPLPGVGMSTTLNITPETTYGNVVPIPITLNIKPGEIIEIPTGIGFDMDLAIYEVRCHFSAGYGYSDLQMINNLYIENIP